MTQADSVLSTPPTNTSKSPCLPPGVGIDDPGNYDPVARAAHAGHQLAKLMQLRDEAAHEVERLLAFLDETDGDTDLEPSLSGYSDGMDDREAECEDEGAQCDDEGYQESGIGDFDGLMEQCPVLFEHCDRRVEA
jgi:hypothetical protein